MINLINYPFYLGRRSKKCHAVSVHWYCLLWWQTALPPQTFHCYLIITVRTIIIASGWNSSDKDGQEFLERGWGWYRGLSKLYPNIGTHWWGCVCTAKDLDVEYKFKPLLVFAISGGKKNIAVQYQMFGSNSCQVQQKPFTSLCIIRILQQPHKFTFSPSPLTLGLNDWHSDTVSISTLLLIGSLEFHLNI